MTEEYNGSPLLALYCFEDSPTVFSSRYRMKPYSETERIMDPARFDCWPNAMDWMTG